MYLLIIVSYHSSQDGVNLTFFFDLNNFVRKMESKFMNGEIRKTIRI